MDTVRILPTPAQIEDLATEFVNELHKIPLYDTPRKRKLASTYLTKIREIVVANIAGLDVDDSTSIKGMVTLDLLTGP